MDTVNKTAATANEKIEEKAFCDAAAFLVHRLRNPLSGIKGFAGLLERDLKDQPSLQKMAKTIMEGADQLDRIMASMLEFAEPLQLHLENTDLTALAKEVFNSSPTEDPLLIQADKRLLHKAFSCFFREKVRICMEIKDNTVIFTLTDCETAIAHEREALLFSPFFSPPNGAEEGAWAQARKIIRAHGGTLKIFPGEEATVITIHLPLLRGDSC